MQFLKHFYNNTLTYDLYNKFNYNTTKKLPKLKKIILNIGCKTTEIKQLSSGLLALELITTKKGTITKTNKANIQWKLRKNNPVGCKTSLRNKKMFDFLTKFTTEIIPKTKNFQSLTLNETNTFCYNLVDTFCFNELEEHYYYFKNLPKFNITLVASTITKIELAFFLKSLQLPIKN